MGEGSGEGKGEGRITGEDVARVGDGDAAEGGDATGDTARCAEMDYKAIRMSPSWHAHQEIQHRRG